MKLKTGRVELVDFFDLNVGDAFRVDEAFFLKMETVEDGNAVDLQSGEVHLFNMDAPVIPLPNASFEPGEVE